MKIQHASSHKYSLNSIALRQKLLLLVVLLLCASLVFLIILRRRNVIIPDSVTTELASLWKEERYKEILDLSAEGLSSQPLNTHYLFYNGIAHLYYALSLTHHDERQILLDNGLYSLRKLLNLSPATYEGEMQYIIGKIYFYKGHFYYDLAEKYLSLAEKKLVNAADITEYLGVIYLDTDRRKAGIDYLIKAINYSPRDILYYTLAHAYEETASYMESLEYYDHSINSTADKILLQASRIGKGRVLIERDELESARIILEQVVQENQQAAEAHFYLGEIYDRENDLVKARAKWRDAYNQNKTFLPALERLKL